MKIAVLGLWHLGCVTAACCARHFSVTALDFDDALIARLRSGKAPLFEPGLDDLIRSGLAAGQLMFTTDAVEAASTADLLWVCYDTPVDEDDQSDVEFVFAKTRQTVGHLRPGTLVLISSQLPVGSCGRLAKEFPGLHFASSPENLRLGKAIEAFEKPDRIIVGVPDDSQKDLLRAVFAPLTSQVIFMRVESAEMVKHALNAFLAVSVTFINEVARICERTGADAQEVAAGLKSDPRIGQRAYLGPGGPFAGGTLARDVVTLTRLGREFQENLALIPAIKESNDQHRGWAARRLHACLKDLNNKAIAVLGLTYKPGTDTLRRSAALELCRSLLKSGASVRAFDPAISQLPEDLRTVTVATDAKSALAGADAAVICTEWPVFREVVDQRAVLSMRRPLILDPNRFLAKTLEDLPMVEHVSVGRPA